MSPVRDMGHPTPAAGGFYIVQVCWYLGAMIGQLQTVLNLLEGGFAQVRILVVGDIMLDRYLVGDVERISHEAPVPVLRHAHRYERPGGAANVAMNAAGLGCETFLCGFWGHDAEQAELAKLLETAKVDTTGVVTSSLPTTSKTRFVARSQQLLRLDIEGQGPVPMEEMTRLEERAVALVKKVHAVILADYAGGALTDDVSASIIRTARAANLPVLVISRSRDLSKYSGATTICAELDDLALATGVAAHDSERLLAVAHMQMQEHDFRFLTIVMMEQGIRVLGPEEDFYAPARTQEVFDVMGAKDTAAATLAATLAAGIEINTGIEVANLAMEIVMGKIGAVPVSREELIGAVKAGVEGGPASTESKLPAYGSEISD